MSNKKETMGMKEDGKPALVPKLRFPEFRKDGEWEIKAIGDVFKVTRGEVLAMTFVQDYASSEAPYPVYSSQTKNKGLAGYYSDYLYQDAITWTTDGANAGDVNFRSGRFYCTNVCGVLIDSQGYANACVAALLNNVTRKHVSYVGNPKLMNGVMAKIEIPFPSSAEQKKIAECLSSVDELIEAQARKVDALKNHKKGLMQQLFPREGETQPRLRFPEFRGTGGWLKVRFIETADRSVKWSFIGGPFGSNLKSSDYVADGVRIIQLQNIGDGEFFDDYRIFTTPEKADELLSNNIYPGDIIMSKMGDPVGRACLIPGSHDRYVMCSDGIRLVVDQKVNDKYFIYSLINSPLFRETIEKTATGSTRKRIGLDELKNLPMLIPKKGEQQKIAECLSSVDELIAAQARKLDALKNHKKGLMQQLFPSSEEAEA